MSISAYKRTQRASDSPRDIERQIFSRITSALAVTGPTHDDAQDPAVKRDILNGTLQVALVENTRLWARLRQDLAHPENQLPESLRAQLISLALFTERTTNAILRGEGRVADLVSVNRSIIAGLSGVATPVAAP